MNREEAKIILSALRNGESKLPEGDVAEALRLAGEDESLGKWLEDSRKFDQLVTDRIEEIPVPENLMADILTGIEAESKPTWNRRLMFLTLAAAATIMIGLGLWHQTDAYQHRVVEEFQRDMIDEMEALNSLDFRSDDPQQVSGYLKSRNMLLGMELPDLSKNGDLRGCKILNWKGRSVSLICIRFPDKEGLSTVHIMTMDAGPMKRLKEGEENQLQVKDWSSTAWKSGENIHVIVTKNTGDHVLRDLIPLS
ncbi:MAG: hypothetical protein P1U89_10980 [Verrucomicrobiales bacterium]|nr:hypothetical protein [Verrucomicrobiales bacterium]